MKVKINADYDYEKYGITQENGYTKWYDWKTVKKHITIINILIIALLFVSSFMFSGKILALTDKATRIGVALFCCVFHLLVMTFIHEILHLIVFSKGKLNDKCIITFGKGTASSIYNGKITRNIQLLSLAAPALVLSVIFIIGAIFTQGIIRYAFGFMVLLTVYGSYTDIYMIFYCLKHIDKNDVIFGLYKKKK